MARFKGNKSKNKEKRPRGGGFGFNKSRELKEFEGHAPNYDDFHPSPVTQHTMQEEVFIINNTVETPNQTSSFEQLSRISMTHLTRSNNVDSEELDQTTEDLGFFFDSTPQPVSNHPIKPNVSHKTHERPTTKLHESDIEAPLSNYETKKRRIILDDSIHIDSDDDQDDVSSISSSEDISMLGALAHWGGSSNVMFEEEPAGHRFHSDDDEDYDILKNTPITDIFDSDQDIITTLDSDEEELETSAKAINWLLDDSVNVPDHMKHSYQAILKEERRDQLRKQKKPKNKVSRLRGAAKTKSSKRNLIDRITDEFLLRPKLSRYTLVDLTHLGRHTVVPKLAKLFKLKIDETKSSETIVELRRTPMTPTYQDLKKSTKRAKPREAMRRVEKRVARVQLKEDANHGKQVASSSTPISSSNVGHRMLAAMGWKEGEALGNNENGIKEPVKVYLRAKQRGLGA